MENLRKLFVSYELALKLKELGFDEYCLRTSWEFDIMVKVDVPLPLYQQVIDWLREKHKIHVWVTAHFINNDPQLFSWDINTYGHIDGREGYTSYNKALVTGIKAAIKLIK